MAKPEEVFEFARQEAVRQGVSPDLVVSMVRTESGGRVNAVSNKGARGPMQLMPATARDLGVNPDDWKDNIRGGVKYIGQMLNQFGDPSLAVAAYNAGPGAVRRAGGIPEFKETQNYVQKVLGTNMAREINAQELGLQFNQPQQQAAPQPQVGAPREIDPQSLNLNFNVGQQPAPAQPTSLGSNITSGLREVGRQIGLTGRIGLEGLGTALDIGGAPISNLINLATGQQTTVPPSRSMGQLADFIGLPQPQNELEKSVQAVGRTVAATAAGTGAGRLLAAPLTTGLSGQTARQAVGTGLATQPVTQLAAATGGAGTAEVARNFADVQDPYALGGLSLLGGLAAGNIASRFGNVQSGGMQYVSPKPGQQPVGQTIEAGRARGLSVEAGDVGTGGGTVRTLRNVGGTSEDFIGQRQSEVTRLIDRTATNAQPANVKSGTEAKVVANDLRSQYQTAKKNVSPLFQQAEKLAGDQPIAVNNSISAVEDVRTSFPETSETARLLRNIDRIEKYAPNGGTYKELRDLQKVVGDELSKVQKGTGTGAYSESQVAALSRLYGSIDDDVSAWAAPRQINGKPVFTPAGAAHERAMEQFRQTVAPFRQDQDIYRVVSSKTRGTDYDRAAVDFSKKLTGNTETADLAMNLMSEKGQKAAQFKVLNDARSAALAADPNTPSIDEFNKTVNLGLIDKPTPQRTILARNPELFDEVSQVTGLLNTVKPSLNQTAQSPLIPYVGKGVTAGATGLLASQAGLGPAGSMALGTGLALTTPRVANMFTDTMTSLPATRFLLGQPNMGTAAATGLTAEQLSQTEGRTPPGVRSLIDLFGQ